MTVGTRCAVSEEFRDVAGDKMFSYADSNSFREASWLRSREASAARKSAALDRFNTIKNPIPLSGDDTS